MTDVQRLGIEHSIQTGWTWKGRSIDTRMRDYLLECQADEDREAAEAASNGSAAVESNFLDNNQTNRPMKKTTEANTTTQVHAFVFSAPANSQQPWMEFVRLPLEKIKPSPTQPRKTFPAEDQREMEDSMRAHGFTISTLLVRPIADAYYLEPGGEDGLMQLCRRTASGEVVAEGTFPRKEAEGRLREAEGCYELVAGERRWRAARSVGIHEAPTIIRQLSDSEVMEIQLLENLQRADLTPMEEAEGMKRLLDLRDAEGQAMHTPVSLAHKLGKTPQTVLRRVRLTRLTGAAREAVERGVLPATTARLIASIPDEKMRESAAKEILTPQFEAGPLSWDRASQLIRQKYVADLRDAAFDQADTDLVPVEYDEAGERIAGGGCKDCPLKAGNIEGAAEGEVKSGNHNLCLNPSCFARKKETAWKRWQEAETDEAKKRRALSEAECKNLYAHGDQLVWHSGLVDLAQHPDEDDVKPGQESAPTWKKMVKGAEVEILVAIDRNGRKHELVKRELAVQAAEANGHKIFKSSAREPEKTNEDRKAEVLAEQKARANEERIRAAKRKALVIKVEGSKRLPDGFWQAFATYGLSSEITYDVADRRGLDETDFAATLPASRDSEIIGVMVEYACAPFYEPETQKRVEPIEKWAEMYGVDLKEVEKAEKAAIKDEEKAAQAAEKAAEKRFQEMEKAKESAPEAASEDEMEDARAQMAAAMKARWEKQKTKGKKEEGSVDDGAYPTPNEHGCYDEMAAESVHFNAPKAKATIRLLEVSPRNWIMATDKSFMCGNHSGSSSPLSDVGESFASRESALVAGLEEVADWLKDVGPKGAVQTAAWKALTKAIEEAQQGAPQTAASAGSDDLGEKIVAGLKASGEPMAVKDLATEIGVAHRTVYIWFATAGKKSPNVKKTAAGIYQFVEEVAK